MSLRQRAYRFADGASALVGSGSQVDHHGKVLLAAGPECRGPHVASPRSVAAGSPHGGQRHLHRAETRIHQAGPHASILACSFVCVGIGEAKRLLSQPSVRLGPILTARRCEVP
jgi:hypothetical protein